MKAIVGIRANAGSTIGFGHIRRCLSLADALLARGAGVVFLVNPESAPDEWIPEGAVAVETLPAEEASTLAATTTQIGRHRLTALIVDSYDAGAAAFASIRIPTAAIVDAPPPQPLPVALLINGAVGAETQPYLLAPGSRALLGPLYVLLHRSFAGLPAREVGDRVERVLVTTGGGDPQGLSLLMARVARRSIPRARLSVIAGRYFPGSVSQALEALSTSDPQVDLIKAPANLHELILQSDVALTAGGQTTYELAASGTPSCAVRMAINQTGNLTGLSASGTLEWIGDADDPDLEPRLEASLARLASDRRLREQMARRGQRVVDGLGASRVCEQVLQLCA